MQVTVKRLLVGFGCLLLVIYLGVVCVWANLRADEELCAGLECNKVQVDDRLNSGFVTADELTYEIQPLLGDLTAKKLSDVNLDSIQRYLAGLDKIESAEVVRLSDHRIRIRVVPMLPVARVWPKSGRSYYVNRDGKKILASSRYRLDVPQISGNYSPTALLPLLDYLKADTDANDFITMIAAADTANIILVPAMRGHVINIGDATNLSDKFHRLRRFYGEVLPVKGYTFYDTISVKWNKQVVATRRNNKLPDLTVPIIQELEHEQADPGIAPIAKGKIKN
ncbi:MAG: hypothetical protein NC301_03575 [Bacteroides sp.]|nr:hypothetical protein [Bacteroides sp.]MCM1379215.1 hypothetical protein [Bacteroides sp.]MCM1445136.1 hypothetical protein [Prevotella sp.]